ncbi:MAG: tyrosine-type recombinase/integrase, partial [Oscillospiraceae bacterium]|nr:tyrosine-type recombinase/integrase [Oscillospiraceae bacterium]
LASDSRLQFSEYCDYVIDLKEKRGAKHSTIVCYRDLAARVKPIIGHIKLRDLRADILNDLYTRLAAAPSKKVSAKAAIDLPSLLKEKHITRAAIGKAAGLSESAVTAAVRGDSVSVKTAQKVADALGVKLDKAFLTVNSTLSPKTVLEHHRLISTVLRQAVKEGLIPFNVAANADPPKVVNKDVNYYQPSEIIAIREAAQCEPIKWRTLLNLIMYSGARRGEVLGLKWKKVDLDNNRIRIDNNLLYRSDIGVYENAPKTKSSERWITLPAETTQLLREWKLYQNREKARLGDYYVDRDYVFAGDDGNPIHPDSLVTWLDRFGKWHGLGHINAHAFRHSVASALIANGADIVSVSKRLGHSTPSVTTDIYAHLIEATEQRNADILADAYRKKA